MAHVSDSHPLVSMCERARHCNQDSCANWRIGNYYRTTQANFEATRPLLDRVDGGRLKVSYLFVRAMKDILVTDEWVAFMVQHVDQPVVKEVDAVHWALWERAKEVNEVLREWLESQNLLSSGN